jgi:hypothetical protein
LFSALSVGALALLYSFILSPLIYNQPVVPGAASPASPAPPTPAQAPAPSPQPVKPAEPKLTPEEIATRLSIWESVSVGHMNELTTAYNSIDAAFTGWENSIAASGSRKKLYQDIINTTATLIKGCTDLETLRSEFPNEQEIYDALDIHPHAVTLYKSSNDFANAVNNGDDITKLRPLAGALRREMVSMRDWLTNLGRIANKKRKNFQKPNEFY